MATDLQPGAPGGALAEKPKVFGLFSMVLFSVSAILVADTVGSSAAMGVQGLGFWIILGLLFFIPYGFVTAELGSAWPDEGGIYVWVKTAFGPGWGTVTSWMYWVNVALLGALGVRAVPRRASRSPWGVDIAPLWEAVIVIAMVWAIVLVGILPLEWSKFVPNLSAALKVIVLVGLGALGIAYVVKNGAANSFALGEWVPPWNTRQPLVPADHHLLVHGLRAHELGRRGHQEPQARRAQDDHPRRRRDPRRLHVRDVRHPRRRSRPRTSASSPASSTRSS